MTERLADRNQKTPNYALRRFMAIGMLGLASFGIGKGAANMVGSEFDHFAGTDIPNAEDVVDHPDQYGTYTVQKGDTIDKIAKEYTTENHDYRVNSDQIVDQLKQLDPKFNGILQPGEHIGVPTTLPPEEN